MKKTLWSRDFTIITIGTLISAIGGTAMSFAFSLVVFDNTDSTMLTGIFTGLSMIPAILIPIIAAPFVDTCERKKVIVRLDAFNGICYLVFYRKIYRCSKGHRLSIQVYLHLLHPFLFLLLP